MEIHNCLETACNRLNRLEIAWKPPATAWKSSTAYDRLQPPAIVCRRQKQSDARLRRQMASVVVSETLAGPELYADFMRSSGRADELLLAGKVWFLMRSWGKAGRVLGGWGEAARGWSGAVRRFHAFFWTGR